MTTELDNLHNEADGQNDENLNPQERKEEAADNESDKQELDGEVTTEDSKILNEDNQVLEDSNESTDSEEVSNESQPDISEEVGNETLKAEGDSDDYKSAEQNEDSDETDESTEEEIPFKNYDELPVSVLIGEAKDLLKNHPARKLREHFNQIRDAVKKHLEEDETSKKEAFVENGGEEADFHYDNPARREFNAVFNDYRKQL